MKSKVHADEWLILTIAAIGGTVGVTGLVPSLWIVMAGA